MSCPNARASSQGTFPKGSLSAKGSELCLAGALSLCLVEKPEWPGRRGSFPNGIPRSAQSVFGNLLQDKIDWQNRWWKSRKNLSLFLWEKPNIDYRLSYPPLWSQLSLAPASQSKARNLWGLCSLLQYFTCSHGRFQHLWTGHIGGGRQIRRTLLDSYDSFLFEIIKLLIMPDYYILFYHIDYSCKYKNDLLYV